MKAKNLYCLTALCAGSFLFAGQTANAQEVVEESVATTEYSCDNTTHYFTNWRNNWFINLGAGVNQPFVERGIGMTAGEDAIESRKMTAVYNLGFGRWMSPYLGFRINAIGGALHWDNPTLTQPANGWTKGKHVNVNFELMWDMFNSLGGVNADRVFSIIPFAGLGGDYMWRIHDGEGKFAAATNINGTGEKGMKDESWTLPVTAGLQFRFRLCKYVDFFAEARATFYGDNWNVCSYGDPVDVNVAAIGGFNFNIGGRGWGKYNECDYTRKIDDLNNEINSLQEKLEIANIKNENCESKLNDNDPAPTPPNASHKDCVDVPLMNYVRFTINSDFIVPSEEDVIDKMAEWLKANPNENVTIKGYADKGTGKTGYNMELSERRVNAVIDALENRGIDRNRLTPDPLGDTEQEFEVNDWNRTVIIIRN